MDAYYLLFNVFLTPRQRKTYLVLTAQSSLAITLLSVFTFIPPAYSEGSAAAAKIKAFENYFKAHLAEYNLVSLIYGSC